ncbi:hypothetical protein [Lichenihabitans psoromatis]|uniref:hypothetical protein n=1 Tax=Lichenihabitans psoromatis TaxID=2528642 RepID=UPI0010383D83|nr:hypothetical protein [Lichenihabitans psoromatis]
MTSTWTTAQRACAGLALTLLQLPIWSVPAGAAPAFTCGGFAMMGGAQLVCSHTNPEAPAQFCTFSWAMMTTSNGQSIVEGSFLLQPGTSNQTVYTGNGFTYALSSPIILCQARKTGM